MIDVLVVDDDFHVAEINAAYVDRLPGFRTVGVAHSAAQALADVQRHNVDLLLLDHYLPDLTGLDLVGRLRQAGHRVDVIMVTAAQDVETVEAALRNGILHYLVKPFTFDGLLSKLGAYAELRRTLRDVGDGTTTGQRQVDQIFGALRAVTDVAPAPSKGWSGPTVDLVLRIVGAADRPLSAQDIATEAGISRSTAQRYLRYLEERGALRLTLRYGDAGRPEHRYARISGPR
ncbi:response regulator [Streptomyces sp. NPDC059740]|uniref:response regulator n=1 Tax=Streptomyces sp. NPDC059740 TaxID=3346926 RepID=UPI003659148E